MNKKMPPAGPGLPATNTPGTLPYFHSLTHLPESIVERGLELARCVSVEINVLDTGSAHVILISDFR